MEFSDKQGLKHICVDKPTCEARIVPSCIGLPHRDDSIHNRVAGRVQEEDIQGHRYATLTLSDVLADQNFVDIVRAESTLSSLHQS